MLKLPLPETRAALTAAIRDALPLQVQKAGMARIAGVGLHMDGYYGSAGLYLLPEPSARILSAQTVDNISDWSISTDWDPREDHAQAFAEHWNSWDEWFHNHLDEFDEASGDEKFRGLLRVACESMRAVELAGLLESFPKAEGFKVIVAEHDEPNARRLN